MNNVYEELPFLENEEFILRTIDEKADTEALLKKQRYCLFIGIYADNCQHDFHILPVG